MDKPMLLIDADWLCFSTAIVNQTVNPFDEDAEPIFNEKVAIKILHTRIKKMLKEFDTDRFEMHFSCSREDNWRRQLVESYKMNRNGKASPVGLPILIEYSRKNFTCVSVPNLEADDTIGIAATGKYKGNNIICSVDKDFKTIPTSIWNPVKKTLDVQSKKKALEFFIYQVIIGDSADGFKGIKGAGPKAALKLIAANSKKLANIWEPLLELAKKKKHDEEYLISQARMAHILQDGDYNPETKTVRLWEPEDIGGML